MSLTTIIYLGFLTVTVILFYLLPKRWNNRILLLASMGFYAYAMPDKLLIMILYVWMIFGLGLLMKKRKGRTKGIVVMGCLLSIGLLFVFKYLNFTLSFFTGESKTISLIAPIGISYITFQCISYLVDVHKKKCPIVKNPVMFFLYAFFFAKVTAGPIESPHEFFLEIKDRKTLQWENVTRGLSFIGLGFVKKLVLADMLAPGVNHVYAGAVDFDGGSVALAAVMYSLQIYFDFSGYTDIARGSALLFQIHLLENFKHPYLSSTVVEFWKRWHISLTDWLKKYIYIPLGGSRVKTARRYLNVFIVFLVSGIWHGAALTFLVWGILHGLFQMLEMLFTPVFGKMRQHTFGKILGTVKTFILVTFAWIFFRADSLSCAVDIIKTIFTPWEGIGTILDSCMLTPQILITMAVALVFLELLQLRLSKEKEIKTAETLVYTTGAAWLVTLSLLFAVTVSSNSFIYFNF